MDLDGLLKLKKEGIMKDSFPDSKKYILSFCCTLTITALICVIGYLTESYWIKKFGDNSIKLVGLIGGFVIVFISAIPTYLIFRERK